MKSTEKTKKIFGTKEWASHNFNCVIGCSHECRYCYARYNAVKRFKKVPAEEWVSEVVNLEAVKKKFGKRKGTIMFPTQHDITPPNLGVCIQVLRNMLEPGNNVLVVSKPHLECITKICEECEPWKGQILFRFTIGALDDDILSYWEPGAPTAEERMKALAFAHKSGYATSISMEPCLDWDNVEKNFLSMAPTVTNSIWIGTLNFVDNRVEVKTQEDRDAVAQMKAWQIQENFERVYEALKDHPLVRWKETMKEALGLDMPEQAGMDV